MQEMPDFGIILVTLFDQHLYFARIFLYCAFGSLSKVKPELAKELGADVM